MAVQRQSPTTWFALGFLATICQVLLLRDFLVVCAGSELGIALLLCTWLSGIAAGAAGSLPLQRWVKAPQSLLPLVLTALALSCPAGLVTVRLAGLFIQAPAGSLAPLEHLATVALAAVLPPGLLVGLAFPLACAAEADPTGDGRGAGAIGRIYALEAAGSFSAGMIHTWLLVSLLPALQTALLSAALLCLTAAGFRRPGGRSAPGLLFSAGRWSAVASGLLLLVCGLTPTLGGRLDRLTLEQCWSRLHPGIGLLETVETPYQRLEAGRLGDQTVFTANGSLLSSYPDGYGATLWGHFALSAHPSPKRVLLVGGLETGLLAPMLRHPAVEQIRCLEQDPALPALYGRYAGGEDFRALSDPRFTLSPGDGRRWIERAAAGPRTAGSWDLIVILLPDPTTAAINRYYTREFYAHCRHLLTPGGLLLCRVTASANYLDDEAGALARSVYATLISEFPEVRAAGGDRVVFAAANRAPAAGFFRVDTMVRQYEASGTVDPDFSVMAFHSLIEDRRALFLQQELAGDAEEPVMINSDWRPQAQSHTLRLWSRFSGDALDSWFRLLFRPVPVWLAAAALLLPALWALAPLAARRRRVAAVNRFTMLAAVTTAGFAGLALELVCIHVYQSAFGTLYRMIGSLVALFMLGLALGGAAAVTAGRRLSASPDLGLRRVLVLALAGQALIALAAPALLRLAGGGLRLLADSTVPEALVLLLAAGAGWFTGLALPAAGGMLIGQSRHRTGGAAALVNSADHLGAAAAAALVGLAAIPRLGVPVTAGLLALLTLCCALRLGLEVRAAGSSRREGSR